jgi:hypothetical protein
MSMPDDDAQPTSRSAADKEQSRQQSRPVTSKGTTSAKTGGSTGTKGGNAQRSGNGRSGTNQGSGKSSTTANRTATTKQGGPRPPSGQRPPQGSGQRPKKAGNRPVTTGRPQARRAPARRSTTTLLTWGAVALVLVIVIVLVVVKVTGSNNSTSGQTTFEPVPASIMNQVENVPESVFNQVGVESSQFPVTPPTEIKGQPPLTFPTTSGTTGQGEGAGTTSSTALPGVFYFGAEYCPYCAAERWPLAIALSRFGQIHNLGLMESSPNDVFASTHTFTFSKADYTSPYISLKAIEHYSNAVVNGNYAVLQPLTQQETNLITKYDNSKYYSNSTTTTTGSLPFIDFANKWFVSGASYSPSVLTGLTQDQIASQLNDPTSPVTQAIISAANYLTASICQGTGGQPSSVCATKGVQAAEKSMGIKS